MIVISHRKTCKSASRLAKALGVPYYNLSKVEAPNIKDDEVVFNYGSSVIPKYNRPHTLINPPAAVALSVHKINTYRVLKANLIPTVTFVTDERDINPRWSWVVCRETITGRNCEGVMITRPYDIVKGCPLYTKFFTHDAEYRIVVYKGQILARYHKANLKDGQYELVLMTGQGFKDIDNASIQAANAIGLDYCGIDVLSNEKNGDYVILEANSGPLLTDDTEAALVKLLK